MGTKHLGALALMNNYHPVDFDEVVEHFFQLGKVPKPYDGGGGTAMFHLVWRG